MCCLSIWDASVRRYREKNRDGEVVVLRKLVAGLFISLDGVVGSAETWSRPYLNDELEKVIGAAIAQSDAILLGRRRSQTAPAGPALE